MLARVGKQFVARMQLNLRPLFQGRTLLLTNTLTGGGSLALGDILEQTRENFKKPDKVLDWRRTGRMFTVGCSIGPLLQYWYIWLDKALVGTGLKIVGQKVLVDQVVASPFFGMSYFLGTGLMEGQTLSEAWTEFKDKFWELYMVDCCLWPPAQMVNFYFLSPKYRVVYVNFITVGWNTYFSYIKHRDDSPPIELVSDSSAGAVQQEALPPSKPLEEKA